MRTAAGFVISTCISMSLTTRFHRRRAADRRPRRQASLRFVRIASIPARNREVSAVRRVGGSKGWIKLAPTTVTILAVNSHFERFSDDRHRDEQRPAGKEGQSTERRDRTEDRDAGERERVEAA